MGLSLEACAAVMTLGFVAMLLLTAAGWVVSELVNAVVGQRVLTTDTGAFLFFIAWATAVVLWAGR